MKNATLVTTMFVVGLLIALYLRSGVKPEPTVSPKPAKQAKAEGLLVDVGNTNCPVMDGQVDNETYIEWKNLRVGFCCAGCDKKFLADPETALDKAAPGWREAAKAIEAYHNAPSAHKAHMLSKIRAKWTVVREPEER